MYIFSFWVFIQLNRGEDMKKLSELFAPAIIENSSINDLWVQEVKFSKKANAAIVNLEIDKKIFPKDILAFESNAKNVFKLKSFKVIPILKSKQEFDENDIDSALDYLKAARPYTESVLNISKLDFNKDNNTVDIELKVPNANFLKLQKTEECLSDIVSKYYGEQITFNIMNFCFISPQTI